MHDLILKYLSIFLRFVFPVFILTGSFCPAQSLLQNPRNAAAGNILFRDSERMLTERFRYFLNERMYPLGYIPKGIREEAWRQSKLMNVYHPSVALSKKTGATSASWTNVGPSNAGGRITGIAIHPLDPNIVYFTAADGGVWKTTDAGTNFMPISDDLPTLSMGTIDIDPVDPSIIYVGTGEANGSKDCYPGIGVVKSTDAGATWFQCGNNFAANIAKIRVSKFNHNIVLAATRSGLFRTTNAGLVWDSVQTGMAFDVVFHPTEAGTVYAGVQAAGVMKSVDTGRTWHALSIGVAPDSIGRIAVDLCQSQPQILYAVMVAAKETSGLKAVVKSTDGGVSWSRTNSATTQNFFGDFGWYLCEIAVHPLNPDRVLCGGIELYLSTDGGHAWKTRGTVHVDQHAMEFSLTNPGVFYLGNDGGFYRSTDSGTTYKSCNDKLPITQFYELGLAPQYDEMLGGGTQDNGSKLRIVATNVWAPMLGADGGYFVIDYSNSNYMYGEYQFGNHMRSTNAGSDWFDCNNGFMENGLWMAPVVIHPADPRILYTATTKQLYRTTNRGLLWIPVNSNLDRASPINCLAISPKNPDLMLAGFTTGRIWMSSDGAASWSEISVGLPNRTCKDLLFDPRKPGTFYTCYSGYDQASVFKTTDAGASWFDISGNLPPVPKNALEINPTNSANLFVGTDFGVYTTTDGGQSWSVLGDGMPKVVIADLELNARTGALFAATHGRSAYQLAVTTPVEMTSLSASLESGGVRLDWRVSAERNCRGYVVERRVPPGGSFTDIGYVESRGATGAVNLYTFTDAALPADANVIAYRLRQIALDGSSVHSDEVEVSTRRFSPDEFVLEQNFPNPFSAVTTLVYRLPERGAVHLSVTDALGKLVAELSSGIESAGSHLVVFDARELKTGVYNYSLLFSGKRLCRQMLVIH
jgi:photosystem II stability/assembly factor-like uncharacterized protein